MRFSIIAVVGLALLAGHFTPVSAQTVNPASMPIDGKLMAMRARAFGTASGDEVLLGIPDLGDPDRRLAMDVEWAASNQVRWTFDPIADRLEVEIVNAHGQWLLHYPDWSAGLAAAGSGGYRREDLNVVRLFIAQRDPGTSVTLANLQLDGRSIGSFTPPNNEQLFTWTVRNWCFGTDAGFTFEGNLGFSGNFGGQPDLSHVELMAGVRPGDGLGCADPADLALDLESDGGTVLAGGELPFTARVENLGTGPAVDAILALALPQGFGALFPAECELGTDSVLNCVHGELAARQAWTVPVTLSIPASALGPYQVAAEVTSSTLDPDPANNVADLLFTVLENVPKPPQPVTIESLHSVAADPEGCLCDPTRVAVTQLLVEFDRDLVESGIHGAANPEQYRLLRTEPGRRIGVESCAAPSGTAEDLAIEDVAWGLTPRTAALQLGGLHALPEGQYRLFACAGLSDGENALLAGDTWEDFAVTRTNLVANPNFDHGLEAWDFEGPLFADPEDADAQPTSGSAGLVGQSAPVWLEQCVSFPFPGTFEAGGAVQMAGPGQAAVRMDFHAGADCSGPLMDSLVVAEFSGDTGGEFEVFEAESGELSPEGAVSARVRWELTLTEGGQARLDDLFVRVGDMIFSDRFERED